MALLGNWSRQSGQRRHLTNRPRTTCFPGVMMMREAGLTFTAIRKLTGINHGMIHYILRKAAQ